MIYVLIGLIAFLIVLRFLSPVRYAVHASVAGPLPAGVHPEGRWTLGGFVYDDEGRHMDLSRKFIGHAAGSSMTIYCIPAGSTFIGDYLDDDERRSLQHGEIVVIDGVAEFSETGLRLRCIDQVVADGTATFLPDGFGRKPRPRSLNEIHARVTHVIENGRVGNAEWIARIYKPSAVFRASSRRTPPS